ncbi:hypothetical protein ACQ5SK_48180 [Bradyrhizobium japonicum]
MQILLPKERGDGEPVSQSWFEEFLEELTGKFGGATSFVRAPGQGPMAQRPRGRAGQYRGHRSHGGKLAPEFWRILRERLERELSHAVRLGTLSITGCLQSRNAGGRHGLFLPRT